MKSAMVCDDCPYSDCCKYCGVSPIDTDEGWAVHCRVVRDNKRNVVVNIPVGFVINNKGKYEKITVEAVSIKKSLWDRLLKR